MRGTPLQVLIVLLAGGKDLLELEIRRRIYEYVRKYPGMHLREISRNLDLDPNHAKYHLSYMEDHGLVSSQKTEGYWRFFPRQEGSLGWRDEIGTGEKKVLAMLRRPVPLHIVLLLLDKQTMTQTDLASATGVANSTLHYHLGRMEEAGLLVSRRDSRERLVQVAEPDKILDLLMKYRPPGSLVQGFLDAWEQLEL